MDLGVITRMTLRTMQAFGFMGDEIMVNGSVNNKDKDEMRKAKKALSEIKTMQEQQSWKRFDVKKELKFLQKK